ncbi:relaxase/mobilization nuclease domain-containing protein [Fodinicurvata fenggangensis]|uniref:relaxase/mobilization nuclease domain-containing protein n=1 Tax=Fodinicurvata fenggangensis TaxID=1121830 RepID=UPI00047B29F1|nr:hypothetical protein [Fodinicurvata fenggangensis]
MLNRDSFEYEKRGRIVSEGEKHERAVKARVGNVLSASPGRGRSARLSSTGKPSSSEAVLKVINWSKTKHSAKNQALYTGRCRESDEQSAPLVHYNEQGEALHTKEEKQAEIDSWSLKGAQDNRSAAWRKADEMSRSLMNTNQALDKRQSAHLIFSVPAKAGANHRNLEKAVGDGLQETLGKGGFRYIYTIHTDHSDRPHAHVVAKATAERAPGQRAKQLRLGPDELQAMRSIMAEKCRERGIHVTATRAADRAQVRDNLRKGEKLHENRTRGKIWRQSRQGQIYELKCPNWYEQHGGDYERRRLARYAPEPKKTEDPAKAGQKKEGRGFLGRFFGRKEQPEPAITAPKPAAQSADRLDRHFSVTHKDPEAAKHSFVAMYRESPKLAVWSANKHPEAFGETSGRAGPALNGRGLTSLVRKLNTEQEEGPQQPLTPEQRYDLVEIRAAVQKAQGKAQEERDVQSVRRQLDGLAEKAKNDPDIPKEDLAAVREIAGKAGDVDMAKIRDQVLSKHRQRGSQDRGIEHER